MSSFDTSPSSHAQAENRPSAPASAPVGSPLAVAAASTGSGAPGHAPASPAPGPASASASPAAPSPKPAPNPAEETAMLAGEAENIVRDQDTSGIVPIKRNPRKFLVAVDPVAKHGQSEKAIALTRDVAKAGDTVILVSVVDELYMSDSVTVSMGYASEYAGHIALEEQVEVMKYQARILEAIGKTFERGVKIITKVIYGEVEKSLINTADDYRVDLIVIGKRKLGRMEKLLSTSVSNNVTSHAHCSVLVAK